MAEAIAGDNVLVNKYEHIILPLTSSSASQLAFVAPSLGSGAGIDSSWQVAGASVRFHTASSSGTLQVEVAGAGIARGSGTNQLTGTMSLAGTADTTVNGTMITTPTAIPAGAAVNLIIAGTMTSLADCVVNVVLQRIA
jgi:hypothetical protein